jgi:hypothetical protein
MSPPLVIPPAVVSILRSAVLFEIEDAASEISNVSARARAESHPEWFAGHLEHFDTQRALLDALGWGDAHLEVVIDLDKHRAALAKGLANQLETERDLIEVDPGGQGAEQQHRRARANAREIERFIAEVGLDQEQGR